MFDLEPRPSFVDHHGPGGVALTVFLLCLAQSRAGLLPADPFERVRMLEYTFLQAGGIGPVFGRAGWIPVRTD